jgi:hypothetical protein
MLRSPECNHETTKTRRKQFSSSSLRAFVVASVLLGCGVDAQQPPPVPQPFPRPGTQSPPPRTVPQPPVQPPATSRPGQPEAAPSETFLGVPVYPGAQFLASFDAGRSQRYYLFGSAATFVDLVTYYRSVLKQKGELVFEVPATHEFDVGKYNEDTMAFPPGVTIKDFVSDASEGYPNPKPGAQPARFKTIIQIVPVPMRE